MHELCLRGLMVNRCNGFQYLAAVAVLVATWGPGPAPSAQVDDVPGPADRLQVVPVPEPMAGRGRNSTGRSIR